MPSFHRLTSEEGDPSQICPQASSGSFPRTTPHWPAWAGRGLMDTGSECTLRPIFPSGSQPSFCKEAQQPGPHHALAT